MKDIFSSLTLFLLILRTNGECVDILSGCYKSCMTSEDCSVSQGYFCQQLRCQGKYNLKADVSGKNATLTWTDFKPQNYQFEYSVAFSTSLALQLMKWTKLEVGFIPVFSLYDLIPGTIYYATVGIWKDRNFTDYKETSEIISFQTIDAEFCTLGTRRLRVGDILTNDCEDRCTCQSTGELKCEPICEQYQNQAPDAKHSNCHNETSPDGCCTYTKCLPLLKIGTKHTSSSIPNPEDFVSIKILQKSSEWVKLNVSFTPLPTISLVLLCIKQTHKENSTLEIDTENHSQRLYLIDRLWPGMQYSVWTKIVLINNQTTLSPKVYFNTTDAKTSKCLNCTQHRSEIVNAFTPSTSHTGLYVGLIVGILSAVAIFCSFQIILLLRRRNHQRSKRETLFFVNAAFGADRLTKERELHI